MRRKSAAVAVLPLIIALVLLLAVADLRLPFGDYAHWLLYFIPLLLVLNTDARSILIVAICATVFEFTVPLLAWHTGATPLADWLSRLTAVVVFWYVCILSIARMRTVERLRQSERALAETAARDEVILENLTEGVAVTAPDGTMRYMNPAALHFHRFESLEQMYTTQQQYRAAFRLLDLDGRPIHDEQWPLSRIMRGEQVRDYVVRVHRPDLEGFSYASYSGCQVRNRQGEHILNLIVIRDITELFSRSQEAEEHKALLNAILERVPVGVVIARAPGMQISMASRYDREIVGDWIGKAAIERARGLRLRRAATDEPASEANLPLYRSARQGEVILNEEWIYTLADGRELIVLYNGSPFSARFGRIKGAILVWVDVTERKKMEQELQRRSAELAALNTELEAFAFSVSHDLRTPLRAVAGFSQLLSEDFSDKLGPAGQEYLDRILNGIGRLNRLIEDILSLSRISRHELNCQKLDLSALAATILAELSEREPDRAVSVAIEPGLTARADQRLLSIALTNLLGNAWKYTRKSPGARIEFGRIVTESGTAFFVRDNGAGFDMTYADKLFKPFQRLHADREFAGSGIGLAIVERVIRKHGGKVWARGEVDKGATFFFTLTGE